MTTPEKFRRRQRLEGAGLLVLGAFTVLVSVYFNAEDRQQQECIREVVSDIQSNYEARSHISTREFAATREIISRALTAETRAAVIEAREDYFRSIRGIDRDRKRNPVPQFPLGECE